MKRRELLKSGMFASAGAFFPGFHTEIDDSQPRTFLITGAHPDDPETGCGGTIARLIKKGNRVKILYFTKGEAGIPGKSHQEASTIREAEARTACKILEAEPHFFGQIDGSTYVNAGEYDKMQSMISALNPDMVFTHWPLDTHPDHRHISLLVYGSWLNLNRKFPLYYYEVMTGQQTQTFSPTDFADITNFEPLKRKACLAHESQNRDGFYFEDHLPMSLFRGWQCGHKHAEAFVRQSSDINVFD